MIPHVATKWFELGLELKIMDNELKVIEGCNYDDKKSCRIMFRTWLDTNSNANWCQIVKALKSRGVGLNSAAHLLESKLTGNTGNSR